MNKIAKNSAFGKFGSDMTRMVAMDIEAYELINLAQRRTRQFVDPQIVFMPRSYQHMALDPDNNTRRFTIVQPANVGKTTVAPISYSVPRPPARGLHQSWLRDPVPPKRKLLTVVVGLAIQRWSKQ